MSQSKRPGALGLGLISIREVCAQKVVVKRATAIRLRNFGFVQTLAYLDGNMHRSRCYICAMWRIPISFTENQQSLQQKREIRAFVEALQGIGLVGPSCARWLLFPDPADDHMPPVLRLAEGRTTADPLLGTTMDGLPVFLGSGFDLSRCPVASMVAL